MPYTREEGWQHLYVFGMSIASQDVTGDGYPEYYISSMADNKLRTLTDGPAQPTYGDSAYRRGVNASRPFAGDSDLPSTAWHAEWDDVNNDGRFDLYVAKGNVEKMPDHAAEDPSNLFIGQPDGPGPRAPSRPASCTSTRPGARRLPTSTSTACSTWSRSTGREPARIWRNAGAGTPTEPAPMGSLAGGRAGPGRAQP